VQEPLEDPTSDPDHAAVLADLYGLALGVASGVEVLIASYAVPPDPRLRLILAHPEYATGCLGLRPDAPPGHKCARKRRLSEKDRERVIRHAVGP
jgi:hypothetical protein